MYGTSDFDDKSCDNCDHRYPRIDSGLTLCEIGTIDTGFYVSVSADPDDLQKYIQSCDGGCYDCLEGSSTDCISCSPGFFLQKTSPYIKIGECIAKTAGTLSVELAVKTTNDAGNEVQDRDGTLGNSFVDLTNAIAYVFLHYQNPAILI